MLAQCCTHHHNLAHVPTQKLGIGRDDGSRLTLLQSATDGGTWLAGGSPTRLNNIYLGERYDATLAAAHANWASLGFQPGAAWAPAVLAGTDAELGLGRLVPQAVPPIRRLCERFGTCDSLGNTSCGSPECGWTSAVPGVLNTSVVSITKTGNKSAVVALARLSGERQGEKMNQGK